MKVSYNWLKDFVACSLPVEEVAEKLTMAGLEVEGITRQVYHLPGIVTGQIKEVRKHPNSDKLTICLVEVGSGNVRSIVCGAPNVAVGVKVPVALEGAELPSGIRITSSKIKEVVSEGMICSEKELELGEVADRIMILPEQTPSGIPLLEAMRAYGYTSLQDDSVLEIAITPNRGDCLSILGIAREVAVLTNSPLQKLSINTDIQPSVPIGLNISEFSSVTILAPQLCPRYTASLIRNVEIKPSPGWLKHRLEAVGIRSINNVVDVTNYVMMEMGQPLHAFDFDKLEENRIVVKQAEENEKFVTLDQVERTLTREMLVIADGKKTVGIAGVMGGFNTEVQDTTQHILLESAFFSPVSIRRTSKKLGLSTEASYRFERSVDILRTPLALKRATQLIQKVAGGEIISGIIDEFPLPFSPAHLSLRIQRVNQILGTNLTNREVKSILTGLEFSVSEQPDAVLNVEVPSHRTDVTREIDLIEEVGRIYGYDKMPSTLPSGRITAQEEKAFQKVENLIQQVLMGEGFYEVINYSFMNKSVLDKLRIPETDYRRKTIVLANPLVEEQNQLRTLLIPHLLQNVHLNLKYHQDSLKFFEISKVFINSDGEKNLPEEARYVAGVMAGYRNEVYWGEKRNPVTFYDLKGVLENVFSVLKVDYQLQGDPQNPFLHPGQGADIQIGREKVGYLGRIHPEVLEAFEVEQPVYVFEINLDQIVPQVRTSVTFQPLPKFPAVHRDLAVLVAASIKAEDIELQIWNAGGSILEEVKLFDLYKGEQIPEGYTSMAYSLIYRAPERTLTDTEVNLIHNQIIQNLEKTLGARLRE